MVDHIKVVEISKLRQFISIKRFNAFNDAVSSVNK